MSAPLPPAFAAMIASFKLELRAPGKSANTIRIYVDSTTKFARWLMANGEASDWSQVDKKTVQRYMVWLQETALKCGCGRPASHAEYQCPQGARYKKGYANNQYRALQQFFKFYSAEEDVPNPMLGLTPPKVPEELIPVITDEQLAKLIKPLEKVKDFEGRRDYAMLRLFICSGVRLSELALMTVEDINLELLEACVMGKGEKARTIKMDVKTARAVDRYLRVRVLHKYAAHARLWLAVKNRGPLTPNGVRQMVERRGLSADLDIYPHMFRHTFTHKWLDAGGAEGDLMELNGWESAQMLRRYGRSARSARARRAYDRVNVMGDI